MSTMTPELARNIERDNISQVSALECFELFIPRDFIVTKTTFGEQNYLLKLGDETLVPDVVPKEKERLIFSANTVRNSSLQNKGHETYLKCSLTTKDFDNLFVLLELANDPSKIRRFDTSLNLTKEQSESFLKESADYEFLVNPHQKTVAVYQNSQKIKFEELIQDTVHIHRRSNNNATYYLIHYTTVFKYSYTDDQDQLVTRVKYLHTTQVILRSGTTIYRSAEGFAQLDANIHNLTMLDLDDFFAISHVGLKNQNRN